MAKYSIREVETITGIKAHTLRIWEKRFGIPNPDRTQTNIRFYNDEELKYLLNIALLTSEGYRISKIAQYSPPELSGFVKDQEKYLAEEDLSVNRMLIAMVEFNAQGIKKVIEDAKSSVGFDRTVTEIIFPFLERLGLLWQLGEVTPAHEHFVSNIFRAWLIGATEKLETLNPLGKTCVLSLPENEWHELGLIYSSFLLKKSGFTVLYLGQSVPVTSLNRTLETVNPAFVITGFISPREADEINDYINAVDFEAPIYIALSKQNENKLTPKNNTFIIRSHKNLKDLLQSHIV